MKRTLFIFAVLFSFSLYSQSADTGLTDYAVQKIITDLTEQSKTISAIKFDNIKDLSAARKNKLKQVQTNITYNLDALVCKASSHKDVTEEVNCYNYPQTINAIEYLLNYETNLKLIQAVFIESTNSSPTLPNGLEDKTKSFSSARSSEKIYSAVTWERYRALMYNLNTADPESWNQTFFRMTLGNSENFRQYIDKRSDDIATLYDSNEKGLRGVGGSVSRRGVLEDIYSVIFGGEPVGPLAEAESEISEMAHVSSKYLARSFALGIEVIKHNQLLYSPNVTDINNQENTAELNIKPLTVPKLEYTAAADASNMDVVIAGGPKNEYKPEITPVPEISFKDKYNDASIQNTITELNSQKNANYFAAYIKLLSTTEMIVGDYATRSMKLSNKAQDKAYRIASSAKYASAGCDLVLAALSFIPTAGIGSAAILTMVGLGAIDEARNITDEIYENVPTSEIIQKHAFSIGLYAYMVAIKVPKISIIFSKAPFVRLGISSSFFLSLLVAHLLI